MTLKRIALFFGLVLTANALGLTAKGTVGLAAGNTSVSLANVTCSTGDVLIVTGILNNTITSVTWGANTLNLAVSKVQSTGTAMGAIYYFYVASGATATVTASWTGTHIGAISVSTIQGASATPLDQIASANGNSTTPSSGATPSTLQPSEIAIGAVAMNAATIGGSWSNGWSPNQNVTSSSSITVGDGFLIVSTINAQTAAKTGTSSAQWAAVCATFKAATNCQPTLGTLGVSQCGD